MDHQRIACKHGIGHDREIGESCTHGLDPFQVRKARICGHQGSTDALFFRQGIENGSDDEDQGLVTFRF